jgi:chromate transport protein ChrA
MYRQRKARSVAARSAVAKRMGSSEFTTWVALAGAAIVAGLAAIYSSSPWVLIAAALIGAYFGYKGEQVARRYLEQRLAQKRSQ